LATFKIPFPADNALGTALSRFGSSRGLPNGRPLFVPLRLARATPAATTHALNIHSVAASDCTTFPRELSEAAFSHAVGDAVEQSYRRGDALELRLSLLFFPRPTFLSSSDSDSG
jgi:hypothetical protein